MLNNYYDKMITITVFLLWKKWKEKKRSKNQQLNAANPYLICDWDDLRLKEHNNYNYIFYEKWMLGHTKNQMWCTQ